MIMKSTVSYRDYKRREFNRLKREAVRYISANKIKFFTVALIFTIVLVLGILAGARFIYASSYDSSEDGPGKVKCYKSVMIYLGDTLDSIAEANYVEGSVSREAYKNEIASINHLGIGTELIPGNCLTIPFFSEPAPKPVYCLISY
ncbi:MAG: hypothetical protein K5770_04380 [Lachnospiraceae bacterium]|nr:hypothetical protein [Lachnospiraceae bacterium]